MLSVECWMKEICRQRKRAHPDWMRPNLLNKIGVWADYSSGSVSLFKWLNQTTQVAQSASTAVCVTQFSRILNPMQSSAQPDTVESLTRRSHILNPVFYGVAIFFSECFVVLEFGNFALPQNRHTCSTHLLATVAYKVGGYSTTWPSSLVIVIR